METINLWWQGLEPINQWFYVAAAFFSVFLIWQLVATILGLSGSHDADVTSQAEPNYEHQTPADAHDTVVAFKLLSIRSVLAFFTLFTWAGALYMNMKLSVGTSLGYGVLWGVAAMGVVSALLYMMRRMTETGTIDIKTCQGASGTVVLDIPAGGTGEIRALCSGVMTHFKARAASGQAMPAGKPVRVVRVLGPGTVEVELDQQAK